MVSLSRALIAALFRGRGGAGAGGQEEESAGAGRYHADPSGRTSQYSDCVALVKAGSEAKGRNFRTVIN